MKIVICGDTHIGAIYGLGYTKNGTNTRIQDYENTLNHIVDHCIQNQVDVFVQTGDAFDSRHPSPEHLDILNRALKRLSQANITSIVIMGNHDYRKTGNTFTSSINSLAAKDYSNVRIVLHPELIKIFDKKQKEVNLLLLPYRDRKMYKGGSTKEDSLLCEQEIADLLEEASDDNPIIAIGHNFFYQGSYHDYGGAEVLLNVQAFNKCDLVVMGHYHQAKVINQKPLAMYIGSMEKINFGDQNIPKFFLEYDTETKKPQKHKCLTRDLQDIELDFSTLEFTSFYSELEKYLLGQNLKDKIVRFKVLIKGNIAPLIKRNEIEKLIQVCEPFYISKIIIETIFEKINKNEILLDNQSDFEIFDSFVRNQELDEKEYHSILLAAKKIIEGST